MRREKQVNFFEIVKMLYYNNRSIHYIQMSNNLPMSECENKCKITMHYLDMIEVFFIHRSRAGMRIRAGVDTIWNGKNSTDGIFRTRL
jgi:hypothetical protein